MRAVLLLTLSLLVSCAGVGCKSPPDPARTLSEVKLLVSRLNARSPSGDWGDINLLVGISNDTLEFLSQDFSEAEITAVKRMIPELAGVLALEKRHDSDRCDGNDSRTVQAKLLADFRKRISGPTFLDGTSGIRMKQTFMPSIPLAQLVPEIVAALSAEYKRLRQENRRIFGSDKWDNASFCDSECSCVANHLGGAVRRADPSRPVLYMTMTGGCFAGGVCPMRQAWPMASGKPPLPTSWTHHVVLLIGDGKGGWAFLDPIAFGDMKPRSAAEWYNGFHHEYSSDYYVSPKAKTIGTDVPQS